MSIYTICALACGLALTTLWLGVLLYFEQRQHQDDNDRSQRSIQWWRDYAGQLKREQR